MGELARLFADSGTVALVALVSPYLDCREKVRELHERDGLTFIEVFVNTPAEECARRDPKGLYARAQNGSLEGLTGVDAPYEAPASLRSSLRRRRRRRVRRHRHGGARRPASPRGLSIQKQIVRLGRGGNRPSQT